MPDTAADDPGAAARSERAPLSTQAAPGSASGPRDADAAERSEDRSAPPGLDRKLVPLYEEAAAVADTSPASACALARLLLRSLIQAQGLRGRHLVRDIGELVSNGAPVGLLRALDVIKLSDVEARRPGELNLANGHGDAQNLLMFIHLFTQHVAPTRREQATQPPRER